MSVFEDCTRSTESSPSEGDTTFDLMFLRIGIHGDALTEVDVMIDCRWWWVLLRPQRTRGT